MTCASFCKVAGVHDEVKLNLAVHQVLSTVYGQTLTDYGHVAMSLICEPHGDCNTAIVIKYIYTMGPVKGESKDDLAIASSGSIGTNVDADGNELPTAAIDPDTRSTGLNPADGDQLQEIFEVYGE